jgi:protein TonB
MFDLITAQDRRPLRERSVSSKAVAVLAHAVIVMILVVVPIVTATNVLPEVPTMMAFVVALPTPAPPPPPPPAAARRPSETEPVRTTGQMAAPFEAPSAITAERSTTRDTDVRGALGGVEVGIEGGIPGGVLGGLVGAVVSPAPPPPPPPPAPLARATPVRIGGQITTPAVVHRVDPIYPDIAASAQLSGVVILEAVVDTEGCVESVKVLRSRHPLLDQASIEALRQWRYSPLQLNGRETPFVLTVTFNFSVQTSHR